MRTWLVVLAACGGGGGVRFRSFTPPPPLAAPGPATPASNACIAPDAKLFDFEDARENAALDAELRRHGGMLLAPTLLPKHEDRTQEHAVGSIFRGVNGERWLVVAESNGCHAPIPLVAIDASREVFIAERGPRAAETRKIQFCQALCGGCGVNVPPEPIVVEVPQGAHLGKQRGVFYPIDVHVELAEPPHRCEPVP